LLRQPQAGAQRAGSLAHLQSVHLQSAHWQAFVLSLVVMLESPLLLTELF
jgi:hypothetical protein